MRTFEFSIDTPGSLPQRIDEAPLADIIHAWVHELREAYSDCRYVEQLIMEMECLDDSVTSWNRTFDGLEYSIVRVSQPYMN